MPITPVFSAHQLIFGTFFVSCFFIFFPTGGLQDTVWWLAPGGGDDEWGGICGYAFRDMLVGATCPANMHEDEFDA